jgi:hypothetical protein
MPTSTVKPKKNYTTQVVLALIVIVGMVGGVTFISQYQTSPPPTEASSTTAEATTPQPAPGVWLPVSIKKWDPASESEFERGKRGHFDFWFENRNDIPLELGVKKKSCTCIEVHNCIFTAEEGKAYLRSWAHSAADQTLAGFAGTLATMSTIALEENAIPVAMGAKVDWKDTNPEVPCGTLPPQGCGMFRFVWGPPKAKETSERLQLRFWTGVTEGKIEKHSEQVLELDLSFVPVIRVFPNQVSFEDLGFQETKKEDVFVWSSIDGSLPLQIREGFNDPCITWEIQRLTPQDTERIAATAPGQRVRPLAAYRVGVTIHERLSDTVQMPLGPFQRRLIFSSSPGIEETSILLTGSVRGDVVVGAEEDKGKIDLSSFSAKLGKTKTVRLTTLNPNVDLQVDRVEPANLDYLKVKYFRKLPTTSGESQQRWELCVEVPAGCQPGALPPSCAVYLKTPGKTPRDIRIPVSGVAFQ